jgi:ATP-dependent Clp protease ATP-binding subunit ClpC
MNGMPSQPGPRLTDRAKRVVQRARDEQQRLGHPRLSAEHILVGLLGDRRGMSGFVLRELGVKEAELAGKVRAELERAAPGPVVEEETVLRAARRWAADLKQVSVGTEHLLLALISSGGGAGRWLQDAGVQEAQARATTERLFLTVRRRSGEAESPPVQDRGA